MAERKKRTRNRDSTYRARMLHMERENDALSKTNRALEERLRVLEAAADPKVVADLEAAVRGHAEAEREAHVMLEAAELKYSLSERRVELVEREAAHLRVRVKKLEGSHRIPTVVNEWEHADRPANGGGGGGLWDRGVAP